MRKFISKAMGIAVLVAVMSSAATATVDLVGVDVGSPVITGSTTCGTSSVTLTGGGVTLWGTADDFHFGMQLITGDATITARFSSLTNAQTYTKTGIMFRESLDANSMNAYVGSRGASSLTFQRRVSTGSYPSDTREGNLASEPWIRLVRSGDDFSAYRSADGSTWTQIGSTVTINMSDEVYVGLSMCGGSTTETVTAVFDNISGLAELNIEPVADAGTDQTVTDSDGSGDELVTLDGSASSDSDGTIVSYVWEENSTQIATGASPSVTLAEGTHTIDLTVTDDGGAIDTDTVVITVESAPVADLTGVDVNNPVLSGSTTCDVDGISITGGGTSLWSWSDNFHYACQLISGDADVVIRFDTLTNPQTYTKTGIMFRESLDYNSMNAFVGSRGSTNLTFQRRTTTGSSTSETRVGNLVSEPWIRLVRSGNDFSAYRSADGVSWTQMGSTETIAMSTDIYIGVAMCGGSDTQYVTADFDNVSGFATTGAPVNQAPVADAGSDITGYDSDDSGDELVTFDGSASSDSDGTIVSYVWSDSIGQIATGVNPQVYMPTGTTTVTLTVTDDEGATGADTVDVTIDAYINIAPVANAGSDISGYDSDDSGDESVTLDGTASSDTDGTIVSYVWEENSTQIATGANPNVTLATGDHTITLIVTDDDGATDSDTVEVSIGAYVNVAPTASAGSDQTVTDSDDSGDEVVTLDGSSSSDSDGTIVSYVWEENSTQIATGSNPNVTLTTGTHTITLTVTDDDGATDTDTVVITVDAAPVLNLTGIDIGNPVILGSTTCGTDTVTMVGGGMQLWSWTDSFHFGYMTISGDADVIVHYDSYTNAQTYTKTGIMFRDSLDANSANAFVGSRGGNSLTFQRRYSAGGSTSETRQGTISAEPWIRLVRSGDNFSAYRSTDGSTWTQIGSTETIVMTGDIYIGLAMCGASDTETVTAVYGSISGLGSSGPVNADPVADAGSDQSVTDTDDNGSELITLDGTSSTDSDGTIVSYVWTENSTQIATGANPDATLAVGSHTITLTVTDDDGATDTDTVTVSVAAYNNVAPIADAGPDQSVTDSDTGGDEVVTLDGTASSDSDGTITSYVWEENSTQIATGANPNVTLAVGTHTITLIVTDNDGATDSDTVVITVNSGTTTAPVADAGVDLTIRDLDNSGSESVILNGFASTDSDGYIASYSWAISGTEVATGPTPTIDLAVGTYTIDLTVTDDDGLTDTDSMSLEVLIASTVDVAGVDVGSPVLTGSTTANVGSVTLTGGGVALSATSDDFHFAYQMATGDLDVTVRLASLDNVQTYTKGGIMFRESLDHNSAYMMAGHRGTGGTMQHRSSTGAYTSSVNATGSVPYWYRLVRVGDVFSAYRSNNGVDWTQIDTSKTIVMSSTIYVGLALCGNSETETVTAVYDNILGLASTGVVVNKAPSAYAGEDYFTRDTTGNGSTVVTLDGSASTDSDGTIASYIWTENDQIISTGATPQVTLDTSVHDIQLTVVDDDGGVSIDYITIDVGAFGSPTSQVISEYKSGISLEVLGDYWDDYIVEQWYHDPKIDPRCTIYINSDVDLDLFHNDRNINVTGESTSGDEYIIIGADGLDGIPDSGDEGIIRYRVDQNMTQRAMWSQSTNLYPAWTGPMSFDDMEYPDSGNTAVVGTTGAVPGGDITDRINFYWRGMVDSVGDEWHVIAVGDDDDGLQSYYANTSSDGKIYYFVVNPTTPACNIITNDSDAQFFTTAPKAYFVPVIRDQTTYLLGDCDIELSALDRASVQYSLVAEGQSASWQGYTEPINTITASLASDTRYELKYRIGSTGTVKTRILHFDPSYPSDTEDHPKDIMWDNGSVGIQRIRNRLTLQPYADSWDDCFNSPFIHRRTSPYPSTLYTGDRWCLGQGILANAFPILIDGVGNYPDMEQHIYYSLLDSFLNLDPVGQEGTWSLNSPTREINMQGYYSVSNPLSIGIAYDWVIKDLRKANSTYGFTAVEDYKIRDMLAIFCNWTANLHAKTNQNVDENGYNCSMWSGSWTHGAGIISAIIDDYDTDLYGTSGAPTGTFNAPRAWTPFPDYPMTWWDIFYDKNAVIRGTPNLQMRSTFWGLLNEDEEWYDRGGYWTRMCGLYYLTMNFRVNYDNYRFTHLESAVKKIAEGGQILPEKWPEEGYIEHQTIKLVNHNFPILAATELLKLDAADIVSQMWSGNATAMCLYEYDWDD